jgi:hypothetical protein
MNGTRIGSTRGRRWTTVTRALVGALALGVTFAPTLLTGAGHAATTDPKYRKVSPPNVFYPVTGTRKVTDLKNFSTRHRGTDIKAPCWSAVYATHPGTVQVVRSTKWYSPWAVRVVSNAGGLVTTAAYLTKTTVQNGQIVQSGQQIGYVGTLRRGQACKLYFSVVGGGRATNPSSWLNAYVGRPGPVSRLFDTPGFNLASFNVLGASHTPNARYGSYQGRLDKAMTLWDSRRLDVIGTQEFQEDTQWERFQARNATTGTWGSCFWDGRNANHPNAYDTENALLFRNATMELVPWTAEEGTLPDGGQNNDPASGCKNFDIPYFNGNIRHVPVALLKEKATGRTAYFLNVHNPADVRGDAATYRARAIAIEKQLIVKLRATGRPVFITGDFNDRQAAFCPLTANMLSISPNSIPSMSCRYPAQSSIDWIFAAGQTRFSYFIRDTYTQSARISDHPIVITRAHLQN